MLLSCWPFLKDQDACEDLQGNRYLPNRQVLRLAEYKHELWLNKQRINARIENGGLQVAVLHDVLVINF